jgi:hypothetical protein
MPKNKIQFLNQIEIKVKDLAGELIKTAVTTGEGKLNGYNTEFPVNTNSGFHVGDEVFIDDKSVNSKFTTVIDADTPGQLILAGDLTMITAGAFIKKTDAVQYLDEAIAVYSKYRPLEKLERKSIATPARIFNLPDRWQLGFSTVNFVEYPVNNTPPLHLDEDDYDIFLDETNLYKLRFAYELSNAFRINYLLQHSFDNANPAVLSAPDSDFFCICNIAAGIYLLALASRYGQNVNPSIGSEMSSFDKMTDQYRRLAKELFGQAAQWLGIEVSELNGTNLEQEASSADQTIINVQ